MSDPFIDSIYQFTQDFKDQKEKIFSCVLEINAKVVVELGSDVGDSTRILASALARTQGHLWTIDIRSPKWSLPYIVRQRKGYPDRTEKSPLPDIMSPYKDLITIITSDSLSLDWRSGIDLLFVDSNHEASHVSSELEKYGNLVKRGGLILLHDTQHREFGTGITQVAQEYARKRSIGFREFGTGLSSIDAQGNPIIDNGLGIIYV